MILCAPLCFCIHEKQFLESYPTSGVIFDSTLKRIGETKGKNEGIEGQKVKEIWKEGDCAGNGAESEEGK
jgi:hypothetical protein